MSHENAGDYAAKHAPDTSLNPLIAEAVKQYTIDGNITCTDAHRIAGQLSVSPAEVGTTIDLLEIHLSQCQLGLFDRTRHQAEGVTSQTSLSQDLRTAVEAAQQEGRLSCVNAWAIAEQLGLAKREVATACDLLQIKITECQLGTF